MVVSPHLLSLFALCQSQLLLFFVFYYCSSLTNRIPIYLVYGNLLFFPSYLDNFRELQSVFFQHLSMQFCTFDWELKPGLLSDKSLLVQVYLVFPVELQVGSFLH